MIKHVRISKHKYIIAKFYTTNWSEEAFVIKKVKYHTADTCNRYSTFMEKKLLEHFMKKNFKRQIKQSLY